MKYYDYLLSKEDIKDGRKKGLAYAIKNKNKWVDISAVKDEINTYDKGTTVLSYKQTAYNIYKDYVSIDEQYRVYICEERGYDYHTKEFIENTFYPKKETETTTPDKSDSSKDSNTGK